jgi:septum formation topological specificity factor MinE
VWVGQRNLVDHSAEPVECLAEDLLLVIVTVVTISKETVGIEMLCMPNR